MSIEDHEIELSSGVRKKWSWYQRVLVPLYHPGQRAMIHRSFFNQLADYQFLAETYRRLSKISKRTQPTKATSQAVTDIVRELLGSGTTFSYFSLHKLFYLAEYEHYRRTRERMTTAYIVRQKDGPYVFELNIKKLKKAMPKLDIRTDGDRLLLQMRESPNLFDSNIQLDNKVLEVLNFVIRKYGAAGDAELKRAVYLTSPMRKILSDEKKHRRETFNRPIDFSVIAHSA